MSGGVTDMPIRACPWPDCGAIWVEDDHMYEDPDRCPSCGRYADAFEYPASPEPEVVAGSEKTRLYIFTETAGKLLLEDYGFIQTEHALDPADYRR